MLGSDDGIGGFVSVQFADLDETERSLVIEKFLSSQETGGDDLHGSNSAGDGDRRASGRSQVCVQCVDACMVTL